MGVNGTRLLWSFSIGPFTNTFNHNTYIFEMLAGNDKNVISYIVYTILKLTANKNLFVSLCNRVSDALLTALLSLHCRSG